MTWKQPPAHGALLRGRRVLIVEDEPLIALELISLLSDQGAEVLGPARDVAESLELAGRAVSAALLDVRLGRETVEPVARTLDDRGVPFAFYTGQAETDSVRRLWPRAPIIPKPCPARRLISVVEALCHSTPD